METEESTGKKKRPVLWIVLIVLVLAAAVVGWQAKSLLPQPGPVQTPAPVTAKVPPQPPPIQNKIIELNNEPKNVTFEADAPPVQATEDTSNTMAEVAQVVAPEDTASAQSETATPESHQEDVAKDPSTPSTPSTVPDQASAAQPSVALTEAEPTQTTLPETNPEASPDVSQKVSKDKVPQASPEAGQMPRQTAASTQSPEEPNIVAPLTIQVGAFRTKTYASDKITDLTQRGYEPYIFEIPDANKRIWYTVRFGQFETRDQATQALIEFKKKEKMDGIISRTNAI